MKDSVALAAAAILGGFVSQGVTLWTQEARAQEPKAQDEIRTKGIVVVDEEGKPRVKIGKVKLGDGIELFGADGKARASLRVIEGEVAMLQVWHKEGPDGPYEGSITPLGVTVWGKGKEMGQRSSAGFGVGAGKSQLVLVGTPSVILKDFEDKLIWKAP